MVVVGVIAILAAVAWPSYKDYILKGKRAQARTAIVELLQQQERYMTQNNTYYGFSNNVGATTPSNATTLFKVYSGDNPTNPPYWLQADRCDATQLYNECVMITAVPVGADPLVGNLSMTSAGVKTCTGTAAAAYSSLCWP